MESSFFIDEIDNIRVHYDLNYGSRIIAAYCGMSYFGFQLLEKVVEKLHAAFPLEFNYPDKVIIVGPENTEHTVRLACRPCRPNEFYFGRGWRKFLRENRLLAGYLIKLSSAVDTPRLLYWSRVIHASRRDKVMNI
ncbi:hypothetical protein PIB30_029463 [Stylosanthes scabra]|uniref:TF-B3 domain-containing protein n=1 Tax=Stylosanthes scabra TaxID=79078 RepID=A0ABU6ZC90_9FABA|nr:hypothetical protein [Stylosanthes scabra]